MKYFVDILKQFTPAQRLVVLVLLLFFTSVTFLLPQYFKTDDCRPIIEENLKMHQDFVKISAMLRNQRTVEEKIILDTVSTGRVPASEEKIIHIEDNQSGEVMNEILKIAESNNK